MQTATVGDLAARIRAAANLSGRRRTLFTFLVGAGFSVSAGMPSTSHLVRVMKRRLESPNLQQQSWRDLLDAAAVDASTDLGEPAALAYQRLLNEPALFPFPPHRQRFITDVVRWAADQHIEMSRESLLMAALLNAGSDSAPIDGGLSQWIAHTLYTTNFDEVLPQTFRYCGEAVAVVDHPHAHGRAQGDAFYPRIVYLHGSHLYYDLRNTEQELTAADRDRTGGVDLTGLFQRFRDTLRSTGLIILGYSGWRDRAMAAIRDALADRESLPFHLYWGAYPDVSSLSDEARSILDEHPGRAFLLEPGKTAAEVLALLSEQLDFKYEEIWSKWAERIGRLQEYASFVRGTSGPPSTSVGRAIAVESRPRPSAPNPAWHLEAGRLIEQANRAQREFDLQGMDKLRPAVEEHLAAADDEDRLTSEYRRLAVTRAGLFDLGPIDEAVEEWTRTVKSLREVTDDYALALALLGLSAARLRANQWDRAEAAALEAFELAQSAASEPVSVRSLLLLGRIALASDRLEDAQRFIDEGQQRAERARLDGDVATAKGLLVSLESRRGRLESARRIAAEQLEYRERNGPPTALAAALQDAGFVEQAAQRLSRAANYFSRAELIFREAGYVRGRAYVIARLGNAMARQGDAAGWQLLEEALTLLKSEPIRDRSVVYAMALPLLITRGDSARAESMINELETIELSAFARGLLQRHRATIALRRDDEQLCNQCYEAANEIFVALSVPLEHASTLIQWGSAASAFRRFDIAEKHIRHALRILGPLENGPAMHAATAYLAQVLVARGRVTPAERQIEALARYDAGDDVFSLGSGELTRAIVAAARGRFNEAEQHFVTADQFYTRGEAHFRRNRLTLERARMLRMRGDRERAAALLRELARDAAARGESILKRLAEEELAR